MQDGGANNLPNPELELAGQELRSALDQFGDSDKQAKQGYAEAQFKKKFDRLPEVSGNEAEFKPVYEDLGVLRGAMDVRQRSQVEQDLMPSTPDAPAMKVFNSLREQQSADEAFAAIQSPVTPGLPPLPTPQQQTDTQPATPPRPAVAAPTDLKLSGANATIDNALSAANNTKRINVIYYDTGNKNYVGGQAFDQIRANNAQTGNRKVLYAFGENDADYDLSKANKNTQRDGSSGQAAMLNGRTYSQIDDGAVGIVSTMYKNDTPEALQAKLQESLQVAANRAKNEGAALLVPAKFDAQGNLTEVDIGTGVAMNRDAMKNYRNAEGQTGPEAFHSDLKKGLDQIARGQDVNLSVNRTQAQAKTQMAEQTQTQKPQQQSNTKQQTQQQGQGGQNQQQLQPIEQAGQEAPPQMQGRSKAKMAGIAAIAAVGVALLFMAPGLGLLVLLLSAVFTGVSMVNHGKHKDQRTQTYNNELQAYTARQQGHNLQKQQNLDTSMQQPGISGPEKGDVQGMGQGGYAAAVQASAQPKQTVQAQQSQPQATKTSGPEQGDVQGMGQGGSAFIPSQIANKKPLPPIPQSAQDAARAAATASGLSGATRTSGTVQPAATPDSARPTPSAGRGTGAS